jgi:tetratricopeptide (TPR) repeat protein
MASLVPGYEYDIFISYRQKDNKYDGWVTEFVDNLNRELEATFKERINVYFDINPHDGLLETHDVDASLKEKLKCLVFIPIISRTYCDQRSFAWEHEFKAFIDQASRDDFGLKVRLPNGNIASRVLPVRIHELDIADIRLCESVLGGPIRGIDFVYTEPGVNRPLTTGDDEKKNLSNTLYRNQINKIANAIREIMSGLRPEHDPIFNTSTQQNELPGESKAVERRKTFTKKLSVAGLSRRLLILLSLILVAAGGFFCYKLVTLFHIPKTIAVIPFTNPGNDYTLASFSVGSMDAIITKLQEIKNLTVRSRVSSIQYLDTKEPLSKIRNDLKINYLIDINTEGTKDSLRLWVGLTKTKRNQQLWAQQYNIDESELMPLFTEIVETIADKLNVNFSEEEIKNIRQDLTKSPDAYVNYLSGNARLLTAMGNKFVDSVSFISAIQMYDQAIGSDPDFAAAYAKRALARSWGFYTGQLHSGHIEKCWSDIKDAEKLNNQLPDIQNAYGFYYYYCKTDYLNALIHFNTAALMEPENYQPLFYMALVYRRMGDWDKSQKLIHKVIAQNPQEALYLTNIGLSYTYLHDFDSAIIYHQKAIDVFPEWSAPYINKMQTMLLKTGYTPEVQAILDTANRKTRDNLFEYKILMDIYRGNYLDALEETAKSKFSDFYTKGSRYLCFANIYELLKQPEIAGKYYDSALVVLNLEILNGNDDPFIHGYLGIGYAGNKIEVKAVEEGKRAIELAIERKNKMDESDMNLILAEIYTMLGRYNDALDIIEGLLSKPSCFSVKQMQTDPSWKPLLDQPAFKTILKKHSEEKI